MIDIRSEEIIRLQDASRFLPTRDGKAVHKSTICRWALHGVRGEKLESIVIGGSRYTSVEAIQRFSERLSRPGAEHEVQTPRSPERASRTAETLRRAGLE